MIEAINEAVNLLDFPLKLAEALGIPVFAGQILASLIVILIFVLPVAIYSDNYILSAIMGIGALCLCVALGWMPIWVLLVICLITVSLWASRVTEAITKRGG